MMLKDSRMTRSEAQKRKLSLSLTQRTENGDFLILNISSSSQAQSFASQSQLFSVPSVSKRSPSKPRRRQLLNKALDSDGEAEQAPRTEKVEVRRRRNPGSGARRRAGEQPTRRGWSWRWGRLFVGRASRFGPRFALWHSHHVLSGNIYIWGIVLSATSSVDLCFRFFEKSRGIVLSINTGIGDTAPMLIFPEVYIDCDNSGNRTLLNSSIFKKEKDRKTYYCTRNELWIVLIVMALVAYQLQLFLEIASLEASKKDILLFTIAFIVVSCFGFSESWDKKFMDINGICWGLFDVLNDILFFAYLKADGTLSEAAIPTVIQALEVYIIPSSYIYGLNCMLLWSYFLKSDF